MTIESDIKTPRAAIAFFVVAAFALYILILAGQSLAWFLEQTAIESESLASLAEAGKVWFLAQALLLAIICGVGYVFSKSLFRPIYKSWLIGALITLPALGLRFLGPNNDQVGAFLQILIGLIGGSAVLFLRRSQFDLDRRLWLALTIAALGVWPFLLWGALGSGTDALLNIFAGLAFGFLTANLVIPTGRNYFLDGLGIGVLLAILGSAYGYDGGQLLLLAVLPTFGFALVKIASSIAAMTLGVGLLAAAPLVFIDPTELTLVLGDLLPWAEKAAVLMMALGVLIGLILWIGNRWTKLPRPDQRLAAVLTSGLAILIYVFFGQHGFYGDRLFVVLKSQADLSQAAGIKDRNQRVNFVYQTLTGHANSTQADLRATLDRFGIHYTPYYLVNGLEVDGGALVRLYLLNRPEVDRVLASPRLRPIPQPTPPLVGEFTSVLEKPGWNIKMIGADKVWQDFGVTGKGIVIGQSDTGADASHPALHDSYRGLQQGDDYNWYDPWTNTRSPSDVEGHGTHTLGIVLGRDGIGVAPGAQWIGCVNLERNLGDPPLYLDCMQFMLAPFPFGGDPFKNGDPTRSAYVLNNSWGCPALEGCDAQTFHPAVDALRAAGIFVVVSAGNDGPVCGTVSNPPSIYGSVLSVGAVDRAGNLPFFSSRGPVTVDGSNRVKPDLLAPGVNVFSSLPKGSYGPESGTSMAGPHLVGVVALMWSANPNLIGDIDRTEQILIQTASAYGGAEPATDCFTGGTPNNGYGYGVVDAYAAVKMALGK
jgi:subtilisin family serine protease